MRERTRLAVPLRDVHPADRLVPVPLLPKALVQVPEIVVQSLPVHLLRHPVDAHGRIRPQTLKGPLQGRHIDQMCQRVELCVGFASSSRRYLQQFR